MRWLEEGKMKAKMRGDYSADQWNDDSRTGWDDLQNPTNTDIYASVKSPGEFTTENGVALKALTDDLADSVKIWGISYGTGMNDAAGTEERRTYGLNIDNLTVQVSEGKERSVTVADGRHINTEDPDAVLRKYSWTETDKGTETPTVTDLTRDRHGVWQQSAQPRTISPDEMGNFMGIVGGLQETMDGDRFPRKGRRALGERLGNFLIEL